MEPDRKDERLIRPGVSQRDVFLSSSSVWMMANSRLHCRLYLRRGVVLNQSFLPVNSHTISFAQLHRNTICSALAARGFFSVLSMGTSRMRHCERRRDIAA